jgi:hypothetical protein
MLMLAAANLGAFAAVVGFGFLVGTIGHILRSRTMIVTGILAVLMGIAAVFVANPPQ